MKKRNFKRISFIILTGLIVLFCSLMIYAGCMRFKNEKAEVRQKKYHELYAISELKINHLVQWHKERISEALFFTGNDPYIQFSSDIMHGDKNAESVFRSHLKQIMTYKRYENIFLITEQGKVIFSVDTSFTFNDSSLIKNIEEAFQTGKIVISDFYYCDYHQRVHFDITALINANKTAKTALIFRVDPEKYLYPLIRIFPTPSTTGETYLVSRRADSVIYLSSLRHHNNATLNTAFPKNSHNRTAAHAASGFEGLSEGINYRGEQVLADIRKVPGTTWYMISEINSREVYSDLYKKTVLITSVALLLILFSLATMAFIYNYRQREIFRELYQKKTLLHHTQEELKATFYSMGDGVITTNAEGSIIHMNLVAEKLTGWKEEEVAGKKLEDVFRIINEETREEKKDLVARVLDEGKIIALSNHINLISRSGNEIPISDSLAPIRSNDGRISGMVLVFSDQSGPRARQKALKESEERFARLFEKAPLGYQSLDSNGTLLEVNQAWLETLGYNREEVIGKWFGDFMVTESVSKLTSIIEASKKEEVVYAEFEMNHKNDEYRLISLKGRVGYKDNGSFDKLHCLLQDITENRMLEQRLRESEEKYRRLTENISDVVWASDINFNISYISPSVERLLGEQPAEHMKRTMQEKFPPESLQRIQTILHEELEKELIPGTNAERSRQIELEHYRADGSRIWIGMNVSFIRDENGNVIGLQGVTRDISELKKNEAELKQQMSILEKFNRMMVGRENQMVELKQEINDLLEKLNLQKKYSSPEEVEKI